MLDDFGEFGVKKQGGGDDNGFLFNKEKGGARSQFPVVVSFAN